MAWEEMKDTIRDEINRRGITVFRLEKTIGLGDRTVRNWLLGNNSPRMDCLEMVLDALGLELVVRRKGART